MKKIISIDFDGTICRDQDFGEFGLIHEKPMPGAKRVIDKLKKEGFKIIVLTVRLNPSFGGDLKWKRWVIEDWLQKNKIPFDDITNHKPSADCYIYNKAIRFTSWSKTETDLRQFLSNQRPVKASE